MPTIYINEKKVAAFVGAALATLVLEYGFNLGFSRAYEFLFTEKPKPAETELHKLMTGSGRSTTSGFEPFDLMNGRETNDGIFTRPDRTPGLFK